MDNLGALWHLHLLIRLEVVKLLCRRQHCYMLAIIHKVLEAPKTGSVHWE